MAAQILMLLGGIGLFQFGMITMTGALRQLASRQARAVLARFTRSPLTGVITGFLTTAAIQSSSATMVTTIGFVGAGLLSFPQALGIVFGANVGSTITGWMVAVLGLKLKLGTLAMPLLFAASMALILPDGRGRRIGMAAAGFSLLFIGLDAMQLATQGVQGWIGSGMLPPDTLAGRALLVLMGAGITVLIQSSAAGVAATLVLLTAGTIAFDQAAALVIGMDIGTTFSSVLAALGGSRAMRQTAAAHVLYNVVTGLMAFAVLGWAAPLVLDRLAGGDPALGLVMFHSLFNLGGVLLLLPFIGVFARVIEALFPARGGALAEPLDRHLLSDADAAMDAARGASAAMARAEFAGLARRLRSGSQGDGADLVSLDPALDDLEDFLTHVRVPPGQAATLARSSALLHQFDHLRRLADRARRDRRLDVLLADRALRRPSAALAAALERAAENPDDPVRAAQLARLDKLIAGRTQRVRRSVMLREHVGLVSGADIFDLTDALRWLDHVADHAARITHYGAVAAKGSSGLRAASGP